MNLTHLIYESFSSSYISLLKSSGERSKAHNFSNHLQIQLHHENLEFRKKIPSHKTSPLLSQKMTTTKTHSQQAAHLSSLHIPGNPLVLTNIYDALTAQIIASLPGTKALATASAAIAFAAGLSDDDLTLDVNLAAVRNIAPVAKKFNLPLSVDFQDGYGDRLEEGLRALLNLGVVGVNLEDCDRHGKMMGIEEAIERVKRVKAEAEKSGVPGFVINARTDVLLSGGTISEAIERGKRYLEAGATTVFVWGGPKRGGISREEVVELSRAFEGKLNVSMRVEGEGKLGVKELKEIGVARISIGPGLQRVAMRALEEKAREILESS